MKSTRARAPQLQTCGKNGANASDRFRKAIARPLFIERTHQPGCQIAAIADIHRNERIFALVEFV